MEKIAQLQSTEVVDVSEPTISAFVPLLETKRAEIQEVPRRTFKYGSTDRHQLDVYYPITYDGSDKTKVLIWVYGGGFISGERQFPKPLDLVYTCVGAYFARRGFVTVIPDYRLAPKVHFPTPAEDVRDAVLWTIEHPEHLTSSSSPNPDTKGIFLMGHSAGAVHAFSALALSEAREYAPLRSSISSVILCGGGFHFLDITPEHPFMECIEKHWGGVEGASRDKPMELLRRASDSIIVVLQRTLLVVAEREPRWVMKENEDFREVLEARTGRKPGMIVAKGHNHISVNLALGTGEGEEWAEEVIAWIRVARLTAK